MLNVDYKNPSVAISCIPMFNEKCGNHRTIKQSTEYTIAFSIAFISIPSIQKCYSGRFESCLGKEEENEERITNNRNERKTKKNELCKTEY